jgi:hypothetical protein
LTLGAPAALRLTAPFFLRRYFALRNIRLQTAKPETRPFKLLLLNLYIRAQFGALCKPQKPSNFRGMLLPPKNPKLLVCASR